MEVSQACIDLVKKNEGLRLRSYLCPAGVWTIGYGTTGPTIKAGMVITKAEAEAFLADDLHKFTTGVLKRCLPAVPNQHQLDAFVSFAYNIGLANFATSTPLKAFKAGDLVTAANGFMLWVKAKDPKTGNKVVLPGLVKRRTEEKSLFLGDMSDQTVERPVTASKTVEVPEASVVPEAPKPLSQSREIIGGAVVGLGGIGQIVGSFTTSDLEQVKQGTQQLQVDAGNSALFKHMHLPEIASGLTVMLSMFIIWKRWSDRNKGVR
jgi:lysozyme